MYFNHFRDQITLINFLGRGAFGEVYEGKAKKIGANGSDMKVAVKVRKYYTYISC